VFPHAHPSPAARQRPRRQFKALRTGIGRPRRTDSGGQEAV
jgi:hypothetical protein